MNALGWLLPQPRQRLRRWSGSARGSGESISNFGVPLMACSFACQASIPRTLSLWSRLEGAIRVLANAPFVSRLNVASRPIRSVAVGLRMRAGCQECHLPDGAREIVAAAVPLLLLDHPGAVVQALQIKFGFSAAPHTDSGNHGTSYACAVGEFEGGSLWVQDGDGATLLAVPAVVGPMAWQECACVRGRLLDTRRQWCRIEEQQVHAVMQYRGERVSVVAYSRVAPGQLNAAVREQLVEVGFPCLPEVPVCEHRSLADVAHVWTPQCAGTFLAPDFQLLLAGSSQAIQ